MCSIISFVKLPIMCHLSAQVKIKIWVEVFVKIIMIHAAADLLIFYPFHIFFFKDSAPRF